jgi:hypothetical protein
MNTNTYTDTYAMDADSRRWWWPSAVSGTLATAAIAAILAVTANAGYAIPVDYDEPVDVSPPPAQRLRDTSLRPCFMVHARWNTALDGDQPECGHRFAVKLRTGVIRIGLDTLP